MRTSWPGVMPNLGKRTRAFGTDQLQHRLKKPWKSIGEISHQSVCIRTAGASNQSGILGLVVVIPILAQSVSPASFDQRDACTISVASATPEFRISSCCNTTSPAEPMFHTAISGWWH